MKRSGVSFHLVITTAAIAFVSGGITAKIVRPQYQKAKEAIFHKEILSPGPVNSDYWHQRVTLFESIKSLEPVVMVGDSLTDGGEWSELIPGASISNRGIGGDTVSGVRRRIDGILARRPQKILMMIGVNDLALNADPAQVAKETCALIEHVKKSGTTLILQGIIHVKEGHSAVSNSDIDLVNEEVKAFCLSRSVPFLDLNTAIPNDGYSSDGLHLSGTGYVAWADILRPLLPPKS